MNHEIHEKDEIHERDEAREKDEKGTSVTLRVLPKGLVGDNRSTSTRRSL